MRDWLPNTAVAVSVLGGGEDLHGPARGDHGGAGGEADPEQGGRGGGRQHGAHQTAGGPGGGVHAAGPVPPGHQEVHPGRQQSQGNARCVRSLPRGCLLFYPVSVTRHLSLTARSCLRHWTKH